MTQPERLPGRRVLRLSGEVGFEQAAAVCEHGLSLLEGSAGDWQVELQDLKSATSVTVAVLLTWYRAVTSNGGLLQLQSVPERLRAIIDVSGLSFMLD
ncbi:MAG: STAS domain-containing protein [Pseudomonadales bacterium]|nr:STAS domain-containing protein [Pseudomonadales bacterium]